MGPSGGKRAQSSSGRGVVAGHSRNTAMPAKSIHSSSAVTGVTVTEATGLAAQQEDLGHAVESVGLGRRCVEAENAVAIIERHDEGSECRIAEVHIALRAVRNGRAEHGFDRSRP